MNKRYLTNSKKPLPRRRTKAVVKRKKWADEQPTPKCEREDNKTYIRYSYIVSLIVGKQPDQTDPRERCNCSTVKKESMYVCQE